MESITRDANPLTVPIPLDGAALEAALYALDVASGLASGPGQFRGPDAMRQRRSELRQRVIRRKFDGADIDELEQELWAQR
jgi:hypothetical protein